ncbi:hypothetical protein E2C01_019214 [Portunus trituberculatus]|uniref:Uncharacterized protein n=1 Tax=Portunus trituberculatus TaxID=210409 RepID=A0A5B7DYU3_PORTR|nr:hypothetical protein [Portunus trituberculatus]
MLSSRPPPSAFYPPRAALFPIPSLDSFAFYSRDATPPIGLSTSTARTSPAPPLQDSFSFLHKTFKSRIYKPHHSWFTLRQASLPTPALNTPTLPSSTLTSFLSFLSLPGLSISPRLLTFLSLSFFSFHPPFHFSLCVLIFFPTLFFVHFSSFSISLPFFFLNIHIPLFAFYKLFSFKFFHFHPCFRLFLSYL